MRRRGATLIELMIACALLGGVLLGVAQLVAAGGRYLRVTDAKVDLQHFSIRAMGKLTRELSDSDQESYAFDNTDPAGPWLVFASPRNEEGHISFDSVGRMLWPKQICYYVRTIDGTSCLCRKEKLYSPAPTAPPAPAPVDTVRDDVTLKEEIVGRHVISMEFAKSTVCQIKMLARLDALRVDYGLRLETQVYCRN